MKEKAMGELSKKIHKCQQCSLGRLRNNVVVGEGSFDAKIMFIGEAPGFYEDQKGRPFVGRAGSILNELLMHINLKREDVFIANILKCRPPNNRNPKKEEVDQCTAFLNTQIELINPIIIIPLGNFSYRYIFEKYDLPIGKISVDHGKLFKKQTLNGIIYLIPMYHPAIATYNPNNKEILLKDFEKIYSILNKSILNI
jgi:DNA polymerase